MHLIPAPWRDNKQNQKNSELILKLPLFFFFLRFSSTKSHRLWKDMKSRTNTTYKWTSHFVYTVQITAAWATGTRARSFWSHAEGFSVLQCTEQCRQAHKWHISQMQSRTEGLTFWVSPTCFWHTQCSCYTTMVSSIKKSCKRWLNSRFNRDAEPTLEAYTTS